MADNPIIAFAYGSNMATPRIRERCPSAKALGIAEFPGHELRWHKHSVDGSGKCDVVELTGASVWGVVFEIAPSEKPALDVAEGLGKGYEEVSVKVLVVGKVQTAVAYIATDIDQSLKPYTWYRALVVYGGREHGLPAQYVAKLESVPAIEDHDHSRYAKNIELIAGGGT